MNSTTSSEPPGFDYRRWPNSTAAFMMLLNCFFGILLSGAVVYIFLTDRRQRTSFNLMCFIRAFNNIAVLTFAFLLVYIPGALLGFSLWPPWIESILVAVSLNFYLFNEFQSIYISINRFIALYFPLQYNKICGIWATLFIHLLIFGDRLQNVAFETYERTKENKYIAFSPEHLMFTALEVSAPGMVLKFAAMFLVALTANILTFFRITMFYLKIGNRHDAESWKRVRHNMKLFFQTVLQDALFFIDNFFTFQMSGLSSHRFWSFICATFVWQSVHVFDGLVMMVFNDSISIVLHALFLSSRKWLEKRLLQLGSCHRCSRVRYLLAAFVISSLFVTASESPEHEEERAQ